MEQERHGEQTLQDAARKALEAAINDTRLGNSDYSTLLDAFGRAAAEHVELLAVRSAHEELQADGSPVVEFLAVPAQGGRFWLCLTGDEQLQALSGGKRVIPTATLTLGTLCAMAEDAGISGVVFNPAQQPNLTLSAEGLREIPRRAEAYLASCRKQKLQEAGTKHRPGWIL